MPYYGQGDYGGGYYKGRGDPGLLSFLGGAAKAALGMIPGGGPVLQQLIPGPRPTFAGVGQGPFMPGVGIQLQAGGTGARIGYFTGGGVGTSTAAAPRGAACPVGYHFPKSKYAKHPCVKNRHMNPANPRALRRAVRREHAFVALAKRTLRGTGITVSRHRSFAAKRPGRRVGCGCK